MKKQPKDGAVKKAPPKKKTAPPKHELNSGQERFCIEYLIDSSATEAAIRAGYSPRTAKSQGARLLTNATVIARVRELQAERSERTKVDADWLLIRLAQEAEADISDLYNTDNTLKPMKEWPKIWRQGLVSGLDVAQIGDGVGEIIKIKLSDRIKRLELIGRHIDVGAFKDTVEVAIAPEYASRLDAAIARVAKAAQERQSA